ncbi:acyl-coenzyme A synthetase ACSM3, mitochondrial isoform X2 [Pseudorasbora parva]|uniref:acyl-coenzyme A synthetase ACSM3, mitochondrial isoform X2 n=1 Tax=Pseudorasbora parva TaxID=51549 RepID=UPI00351DC268
MSLYVLRKTLFKRCLKYANTNEIYERGYWLQMCRFKTSAPKNFCDIESTRRIYNIQVPLQFNFAKDVLEQWESKEKTGQRSSLPALWWVNDSGEEVKWSFEELGFHSRKLANVLHQVCRLERGDRVFLVLPRVPEWWLVNVACLRTGTVLIPGTSQLTARDIRHRLQSSGAKCVITDETLAPLLDTVASECPSISTKLLLSCRAMHGWGNLTELMGRVSDDHVCVDTRSEEAMTIFFTSGTTGSPKMTQHSHCSYGLGLTVNGRTHSKEQKFSGFSLQTLSSYPITTFCTAPTAYRMLVQEDMSRYKFQALEHCLCAGEPINPEVMLKWKELTGLDIYEGYGQTETVLIAGTFKGMKIKPGSFGKASPGYDVQVVDEDGSVVPRGQEGDLGIRVKPERPFSLFTEYTGEPERTAECFRGDFYLTGDRGMMDEDGYLWFIGRADDVILSAGYRIGPFEVENALIEHPAVAESAVVSSPDPVRGEVVKAFVVLTADFKFRDHKELIKELQAHVKTVTAPYKYPRKIEFVDHLPKTVSGKIRRVELRKIEWGQKTS